MDNDNERVPLTFLRSIDILKWQPNENQVLRLMENWTSGPSEPGIKPSPKENHVPSNVLYIIKLALLPHQIFRPSCGPNLQGSFINCYWKKSLGEGCKPSDHWLLFRNLISVWNQIIKCFFWFITRSNKSKKNPIQSKNKLWMIYFQYIFSKFSCVCWFLRFF